MLRMPHPHVAARPALRRAALAFTLLLGLAGPAGAQDAAGPGADLAGAALARHKEAASVVALTTEGRLLLERDTIKLDGYGYCGQAIALAERGEFRQSIRAASKALYLGLQGDDDELVGVAMRDLAIAYNYAGWLAKAEEFAKLALARPARNPSQTYAPAYKILGDVAQRRGQYREALAQYARGLDVASPKFRPLLQVSMGNAYVGAGEGVQALALFDQVDAAARAQIGPFFQRSRANALRAGGRLDEALELFGQVASDTRQADADYHRMWANEGIARIRSQRGDDAQALTAYLEATRLAEALRARFRSDELKAGLFGDVQQVFEAALRLAAQRQDWATAWALSEASRSRQLLDSLRDRATDTLAQRSSLAQLQNMLGAQDAVLQFHVLDDITLVWQIRKGVIEGARLDVGEEELRGDVDLLRDSIVARRSNTQRLAQALYAKLLPAPFDVQSQRVYVVPHGPLHYLPFQALHDGRGWFIERHAVAVWPSASVGVQLAARPHDAPGTLLAFGNPSTDRNVPLPGAEAEVRQISALFPRNQVFFQNEATKARFKTTARGTGVLHVAAHAEVDDVDPMFSRILFATGADDTGLLEAREIYGLDLKSVSLVTLSACESGLGRIANGDEIMGFTRSFLSAGTDTVIASLWPVADDATQVLMTRLYRDATSGTDVMDALRNAQLEVLKIRRFAHPFFWAPFSAIGNGALRIVL